MKGQLTAVCLVAILFGFSCQALAFTQSAVYQVTFATEECNGDTGFATVGVDLIYKIQAAGCTGADGQQLKQLLVHDGMNSFVVYTVTQEESVNITNEIKAYMASRRGILDRSGAIIVNP